MSVVIPAHLAVDATRSLAQSALPDAPAEPDRVRARPRVYAFLRALFRRATPPAHSPGRLACQTDPAG